tara:strand:+ start:6674 stop:6862 length:189 start_codon:yes stop_codon:yes gene_type:complete
MPDMKPIDAIKQNLELVKNDVKCIKSDIKEILEILERKRKEKEEIEPDVSAGEPAPGWFWSG